MRFKDFNPILTEAKGIFGRKQGDEFAHTDGRRVEFVAVDAFPSTQEAQFESPEQRDEAIVEYEERHKINIEWVNQPRSNMLAFAVAQLLDQEGQYVFWGKYLQSIKGSMMGAWSNKETPPGWSLQTKGAKKISIGYDPQTLIGTDRQFSDSKSIIDTVKKNLDPEVAPVFVEALTKLSQGDSNIVFPNMYENIEAIRDYFGEIMQPLALVGGVIQGEAEDARQKLAQGAAWKDCNVMWPQGKNAALCDSFMIAPNGQEIGISTKGGSGASASAKNLYDAYKKAEKENNTDLLNSAEFTIGVIKTIAENSAKEGPLVLAKELGIEGISNELKNEIFSYIDQGKSNFEGISAAAKNIVTQFTYKMETKGFNAGFAILAGIARMCADRINSNPDFGKGAMALMNQSSIIQIYTKMGKKGDDAVLSGFKAVYPPRFSGTISIDPSKNYYSTRLSGKLSFKFN